MSSAVDARLCISANCRGEFFGPVSFCPYCGFEQLSDSDLPVDAKPPVPAPAPGPKPPIDQEPSVRLAAPELKPPVGAEPPVTAPAPQLKPPVDTESPIPATPQTTSPAPRSNTVRNVHAARGRSPSLGTSSAPRNNTVRNVFVTLAVILFLSWLVLRSQTSSTESSSAKAACANIKDCVKATMIAMSKKDVATVKKIAEKIDTFGKPARGNGTVARKLNDEGLRAFRQNDFAQAAAIFARAQRDDPSDEEVATNVGYARLKAGDFDGASQALTAALLLNPRRTSAWLPIAELAARRDKNTADAVSALLVAYEWTPNKKRAIDFYTTQVNTETHPQFKTAYKQALERVLSLQVKSPP